MIMLESAAANTSSINTVKVDTAVTKLLSEKQKIEHLSSKSVPAHKSETYNSDFGHMSSS